MLPCPMPLHVKGSVTCHAETQHSHRQQAPDATLQATLSIFQDTERTDPDTSDPETLASDSRSWDGRPTAGRSRDSRAAGEVEEET